MMDRYDHEILEQIHKDAFRQAITAIAEYEISLLNSYAQPTFELDLFQSEAHHLSFHSSFTGWTPIPIEEAELSKMVMLGFDILLILDNQASEVDLLKVFSYDMGKIADRVEPDQSELTEKQLQNSANMMASNFGVVKDQVFRTIGKHSTLVQEIAMPMGGSLATAVNLENDRRFYYFYLATSSRNREENRNHLFELVKTIDFNYKPADEVRIDQILKRCTTSSEPEHVLKCVRELAIAGEYNAATDELLKLRSFLASRMPEPYIEGNQAYFPAYNITLVNPDPQKWKLSMVENGGTLQMLLLEDRWSVKEEGMGILVMDLVLTYGTQVLQLINDEESQKEFLIGGGRGAALNVGDEIEDERFTMIKNDLAYEATFSMNVPGLKGKLFAVMRSGYMVGVLIMADIRKFQEKVAEFEEIIQGELLLIGN